MATTTRRRKQPATVDPDVEPAKTPRRSGTVGAEVQLPGLEDARKQPPLAARAAAITAAEREAIKRAVGGSGYLFPEVVDRAWFIADHPAPMCKCVLVDPDLAQWLLDTLNTDNRPLDPQTEDRYAAIIESDQWHTTHQGGAIDWNKKLQDMQHRLRGVVKSGKTVAMMIFVGMDPANYKAIDEGRLRTAAQLLAQRGIKYSATAQGIVKLMWTLDGGQRSRYRERLTNENIVDMFDGDPEELTIAARFGQSHSKRARIAPAPLGTAYYLTRRENGTDNPYVAAFWRGFTTERKLDPSFALTPGDPRTRTLEYFDNLRSRGEKRRARMEGIDQLCLLILTWNYVVEGKTVRNMRWAVNMDIPRVMKVPYPGSACPELLTGEVDDTVVQAA